MISWVPSVLVQDREDVVLAQNDVLLSLERDLAPGVLAEEDLVTGLDVEGTHGPVVEELAGADRDHATFLRLLLGRVGNDDPALRLRLLLDALHQDAVVQRSDLHALRSPSRAVAMPPGPGAATRVSI